ncbi:MAG TPA: hypothetical protein PLK38_07350 [Methanoregulaceae archaeon]|nr:hypothetical protein [Methanoregulaceae archaeon]
MDKQQPDCAALFPGLNGSRSSRGSIALQNGRIGTSVCTMIPNPCDRFPFVFGLIR